MKALQLVALSLSVCIVAACASMQQAAKEREKIENEPLSQAITDLGYEVLDPVKQVVDWNIYNWKDVDQQAVIIWIDAFHPYLFTLRERCPNLEFAQTIGVSSTGSVVTDFDAILVPDPPGGGQQCFIDKIYPLKKADTDKTADGRGQ